MPTPFEVMFQRQLEYAGRPLTRHSMVSAHLDYAWDLVRARLDGLTDEEYFWEPAPGCWTVRRLPEGRFMADWEWPAPSPPPFTTIAWRLSHIGLFLTTRANHHFGDRSATIEAIEWPGSAARAVEWIDGSYGAFREGVASLDDASMERRSEGEPGSPDGRFPIAMMIQHITLELIHHGAEVALLRDLYLARGGRP